ncbi:uncharacterized protein O3C94_007026 [Discoglossus pictus]
MEVGMLKSELNKKTKEVHELEVQIQTQKESLNRASDTLKETKKAATKKIHDKETKREALQKELLKAQNQYSACYDELLHREKLLHKLKEENIQLTEQIKQQSQDISKMSEERKKLELKLAVVTERHKTAQQEVNNRDQIILHFKTDLKMSQEKYLGCQEELRLQEAEVSRLQQKLKSLQTEACELWEKNNELGDQLSQAEKAKQQALHEQEIHLGQIQNYTSVVEKLQHDLDVAKHSHNTDLERWNQKTSLMQKELISATETHQQALLTVQEYKDKLLHLQLVMEKEELFKQEIKNKLENSEDIIKKQNEDIEQLKVHVFKVEQKLAQSCNKAKASESAVDQLKKSHKEYADIIESLRKRVECLQIQVKESTSEDALHKTCELPYLKNLIEQSANKKEIIHSLEAEILILQHQYKEKSDQVETFEDLIDQLTEQLHSSKDDVKLNKEQCQQYEQLLETMKTKVDNVQTQLSESEDAIEQLRSEMKQYMSCHAHSDEEYNTQASQLLKYQEEITMLRNRLNEKSLEIRDCQLAVEQKNADAANVLTLQKKYSMEIEELEQTLQSLKLEIIGSQQKHHMELAQREQHIAQLEKHLVESSKVSSQKHQAISKIDDLLRKSEADLLQAREGIKVKTAEAEHLDSMVKKLEESIQYAQKEKNQMEKENNALRAENKNLCQELLDVHKLYRETAQELASQEEKLLLLESSLKATQEQLSEQIAETVRQEQNSRKCQTDLKTLKERVTASEEENSEYKNMIGKLKTQLTATKAENQQKVQENLQIQQAHHKLETEMGSSREHARHLQQQAKKNEEEVRCLREELNQGQLLHQDQQKHIDKLKQQISNMENEMENLRSKMKSDAQMFKEQQNCLLKLEAENHQTQQRWSRAQDELLETKEQWKMLQVNLMTTEDQMKHHTTQADFYEKTLAKLLEDLEHSKEQCRKCTENLESAEQNICDLKLEITSLQENHKETVEKLNEKTKEASIFSAELESLQSDNKTLKEEIAELNEKIRKVNAEKLKFQDINKNAEEEVLKHAEVVLEFTNKLSQVQQQSEETVKNLRSREEELAMIKSNWTGMQEKLNEVAILKDEIKKYELKNTEGQKELEVLRQALEAAQTDNSRLHQESESVAANVNQWIKEQKLANENLGEKIRQQNQLLAHLTSERDHWQKKEGTLTREYKKLRTELEKNEIENEKLKIISANQHERLEKLWSQLEAQEQEQTSALEEKLAVTEDIQTKLKANINSISFLNQKLDELSQENGCLRQQLEDEKLRCKQLEIHLETCSQTICNLFTQLKDKQEQKDVVQQMSPPQDVMFCNPNYVSGLNHESLKGLQIPSQLEETEAALNRDLEPLVLKNSEDKSYWIQRVGELSVQLQENTEYWTEKMNKLTNEIQQKCVIPMK